MRRICACSRRRRAEDDGGGGVEVLGAVVLADSEDVQPDLIGVLDLLDQVAQPIRRRDLAAGVGVRGREAVDADLHHAATASTGSSPSRMPTESRRASAWAGSVG